MKSSLHVILTLLICVQTSFAQTPVVYLPLDQDLNDASGNALNASDAGSESTQFVNDADRGQVASFPVAAHAQLPLDEKLTFGEGDFSFAFWVKIDANIPVPSDPVIFSNKDWGSGSNIGYLLALDGADDPGSHLWTVNVSDGGGNRLDWDADDNSTPGLKDGNWHFVAVAFDRDATMNVYFDGELKQSDAADDSKNLTLVPGTLDSGLPITIMQDGTGAYGADFSALLDDILIYDVLLSDAQVMNLYENGYSSEIDPAFGSDFYLPLDENLNDASGNDLNATDAGTEAVSFIDDAERGKVASFPQAAHAQLPLDDQLAIGESDFSFSFWIKIDENIPIPSDPVIFSNKDWGSGGNSGWLVALDGADDPDSHLWTVNASDGAGSRLDWDADDNETPGLKDGNWHFVAVAFDRDATMNVYFDGELKQSDPADDSKDLTLIPGSMDSGLPITLMQDGTGAYGADFAALLDEVRFWKGKIISDSEVNTLYTFVPEPPKQDPSFNADVYIPFDGNLNDASGNNLNATDAGAESVGFVEDSERGMVANFPAAAHAQLPLDDKLAFGEGDFSFAFWVKIDANIPVPSDPVILSNKDWGSGGNVGWLVALDGADDQDSHLWTVNASDGSGSRLDWDADDNSTPGLKDGDWHFVAVAFDRDATMNVYFDGELKQSDLADDSKNLTLIPGTMDSGLPITIMQDGTGGYGADFAAMIDDLRMWKGKVLADEEVMQMYNFIPQEEGDDDITFGAEVYLPLDENLNDLSNNRLNAVDAGIAPVTFGEDEERGLVAFFEEAAHATLPLDSKLEIGEKDFSVAFWVKIDANIPVPSDPVILSNKDWGSGSNPGFLVALDGADDPSAHLWTVNASDGQGNRLDWDADDNNTPNLKDGNWHFVAVSFDRDSTMNVYFDGELKQSDPADDSKDLTLIPGSFNSGLPFTLMQDGTGAYGADFAAMLDDVRIWVGDAITPQQVLAIYNPDDKSYEADVFLPLNSDLNDFSGNGLNGTDAGSENTTFVIDDNRGFVADFSVAAHVQLPDDPLLNFGTDDFSVGFWIRIDPNIPTPGDPVILGNKDWGSGSNPGFLVALDGADDPSAHLWTINASDGAGDRLDWDADDNETANLKDGEWHMVLVSFDRDETMNVYFDGELKQTDPADDSRDLDLIPGNLHADLPFTIMQDATGAYGSDFSARLDNIRIWKRVVSAAEVARIFSEDEGNKGAGDNSGEIVLDVPQELMSEKISAYPNPLRDQATISYQTQKPGYINLSIFNSSGQVVEILADAFQQAGDYTYHWNAGTFKPGIYFYRLRTSDKVITKKLLLIK